jgi:hypothetical protein
MPTITITADGQPLDIETKPLTVICHPGEQEIACSDPNVVTIDAEATVAFARSLTPERWQALRGYPQFAALWRLVWGDVAPPEDLAKSNLGMRHVVGLIVLTTAAVRERRTPLVKLPETYLHPRQCLGLADLFTTIQKGGAA